MAEVVFSSEDLTVFGGPSSINLDIDIGAQGVRGTVIHGLIADPRTLATSQLPSDLIPRDLGINISPSTPDYLTVYQKVGTSPQEWISLYSIFPNILFTKGQYSFNADGVTTVPIALSTNFIVDSYDISNFSAQVTVESLPDGSNNPIPVNSSITLSVRPTATEQFLDIKIKAIQFSGGSWIPVTGIRTVHALASVV